MNPTDNTNKVDTNKQQATPDTIKKEAQTTTPKQESKDPFSILDFVKEQIAAKESKTAAAETKKTDTKKVETKVEEKKTEAVAKEGEKKGTDTDDETQLSPLTKSLLGEEDKKEEDSKKTEAKVENKEGEEEPEIKLPETASVAAKDAFKKVNSERAKLKKELAELKTQKEELEKKVTEATNDDYAKKVAELEIQLEAYKKENEEAETKLYALDVQQTKRYKELITNPLQGIASEVETIAKNASIDPVALRKAMVVEDTKVLSELIAESEINDFDKVQLAKLRSDVKDILKTREALETDSKAAAEAFKRAEEEQFKQMDAKNRKEYSTSLKDHKTRISNIVPALFKNVEGDDSWNSLLEQYDKFIEVADPTKFTADQTAQTITMAGATPILFAALDRIIADNKALTDRIKKLTKANPSAGPSASAATTTNQAPKTEGSIGEFVKEQMARRFSGR